jgi:quinohemoprotein ethanol dehydrogenase
MRHWLITALAALGVAGVAMAWNRGDYGQGTGADWPGHGGAADESGFSQLAQIRADNVGRLGLAWFLDLPGEVSLEATPLAVNGVLYFTGSFSAVYAVDGRSGRQLWRYDPEIWKHEPERMRLMFGVNRGPAYADGRVFVATLDGRLIALDAASGKALWSVATLPPGSKLYSTGAPRVMGDKVIIGQGGGDFGSRGFVTAYDARTGRQAWRFYVVPGSPEENRGHPALERAAATWSGEYWKTGTGGTVWNGMTFDPELNRIYIGTGNSGPYDPAVRSPGDGDNLYLASIVALDADTGRYVWHYQVNPREAWDYKATMNIIAATLTIDGKPRKVLMQAPTNGFFYVLDRETGKLISAGKTGKVTWADHIDLKTGRPVEAPNIRYETGESEIYPSPMGAHNWQAMSFSPDTGMAYIPAMQAGVHLVRPPAGSGMPPGSVIMEPARTGGPDDGTGSLVAWDAARQRLAWKVRLPSMWNGGTLATHGGLVFQGTGSGQFSAYDARDGRRLWQFEAGLGIQSAPISYAVDGKQYVAVLVGYGGSGGVGNPMTRVGWKFGAQMRRLLVFALDGKAVLPPSAPPDFTVQAVDDPAITIAEADVRAGRQLYMGCIVCHGYNLNAGGIAPDLRESGIALQIDSLWSVLHDGVLASRGMPRFDNLTRDEVRQLHAYIRAGAREALGTRKAPSAEPAQAAGVTR